MVEVIRSFLFDGATFKRTMSDLGALVALAAMFPGAPEILAATGYGAQWAPLVIGLISFVYSARARQVQDPPTVVAKP